MLAEFVFVVVDHKYIEKPARIRFECDGKRRSEFDCSLTVCAAPTTEDLFEVESLHLAQPGALS